MSQYLAKESDNRRFGDPAPISEPLISNDATEDVEGSFDTFQEKEEPDFSRQPDGEFLQPPPTNTINSFDQPQPIEEFRQSQQTRPTTSNSISSGIIDFQVDIPFSSYLTCVANRHKNT